MVLNMLTNTFLDPQWVTAIATALMALATIIMAIAAIIFGSRQWGQMKLEKEKYKAIELTQKILVPFIYQLRKQILYLEERRYRWLHTSKTIEYIKTLSVTDEGDKIVFNDFKKTHPELQAKIEEHDKKVQILQKNLEKLGNAILTQNFQEPCEKIFQEWNKNPPEGRSLNPKEIQYLLAAIIDDPEEIHEYTTNKSWGKHAKQILKIIENKEVKKAIEQVNKTTEELLAISKKLEEQLEKIRNKQRQKYQLLAGDIKKILK